VRYGKIDVLKIVNDNTAVINIKDEDLREELLDIDSVKIALDEDDINLIDDDSIYYDPIGMKVIWNDKEVAVIKDFFYNGAHYVYEIVLLTIDSFTGRVVLIPDVDAFVVETNVEERFIRVVDLDQFIDL
jgi:ribosomal 30S subunit maturation factor RimM